MRTRWRVTLALALAALAALWRGLFRLAPVWVAVPGFSLVLGFGLAVWAAPPLRVQDFPLGAEPYQVRPMTWGGGRALSVFALEPAGENRTTLVLMVLKLGRPGWKLLGKWPLPPGTRYVEPLRLGGGAAGWLVLTGGQWRLALPAAGLLIWRPLCPCDTVYSHGGGPDPGKGRFAFDLDRDGKDEVVLPYSSHLEGYRITAGLETLEPLWRVFWNENKRPLPRHPEKGRGFVVPPFSIRDVQGDGGPDLVIEGEDGLRVAALPRSGGGSYVLDARIKALALRGGAQRLPPTLREALGGLPAGEFKNAEAFLRALFAGLPEESRREWLPHLPGLLRLGAKRTPPDPPYRSALPKLGPVNREQDQMRMLALGDMDGDRVLDVLHLKVRNADSKLSRENELRWYRGRMAGGRLEFGPAEALLASEAGSFAQLIHPRADRSPPLALLLATTEVSFSSVLRALARNEATLDVKILAWRRGVLSTAPRTRRPFTFRKIKGKGRRVMLLGADLNGDGFRDFVLNPDPGTLTVLFSRQAPARLDAPPVRQEGLVLPSRPERVLVNDLDEDGREELILWYRERYHGPLGLSLRAVRMQ